MPRSLVLDLFLLCRRYLMCWQMKTIVLVHLKSFTVGLYRIYSSKLCNKGVSKAAVVICQRDKNHYAMRAIIQPPSRAKRKKKAIMLHVRNAFLIHFVSKLPQSPFACWWVLSSWYKYVFHVSSQIFNFDYGRWCFASRETSKNILSCFHGITGQYFLL